MSSLTNSRVILKFNNSILVQKNSSSLYSNFILNLYIVYVLNNSPRTATNNLTLKKYLFGTANLTRSAGKSKLTYNGQGIAFGGKYMLNYVNESG